MLLWHCKYQNFIEKDTVIMFFCPFSNAHNFIMTNEKTPIKEILSTNLKAIRHNKKMTQEELAEKAGLTVKYISNIERGLSFVSAEVLDSLARSLDVPVYELFIPEEIEDESKEYPLPRGFLKKELYKLISELT